MSKRIHIDSKVGGNDRFNLFKVKDTDVAVTKKRTGIIKPISGNIVDGEQINFNVTAQGLEMIDLKNMRMRTTFAVYKKTAANPKTTLTTTDAVRSMHYSLPLH